jgi:hypothetical protein
MTCSITTSFCKTPEEDLDYKGDWAAYLEPAETISTSAWVVPEGVVEGATFTNPSYTTIWLSAGSAGNTYVVSNEVLTSLGRTAVRSFKLNIVTR